MEPVGVRQRSIQEANVAGARHAREVVGDIMPLEEFKRRFDESAPPTPAGIAVLTDSDDTTSYAAGDYANFRVCCP